MKKVCGEWPAENEGRLRVRIWLQPYGRGRGTMRLSAAASAPEGGFRSIPIGTPEGMP